VIKLRPPLDLPVGRKVYRAGESQREEGVMELTLLTVPACPNAAAFEERLAAALADQPGALIRRQEIADEQQAAAAGMHGSPTLLIDGTDPFAGPDEAPSLSCRLYRDKAGRPDRAPSVADLRQALKAAGHD
jgi:hypothetical protein